MKKETLPPLLTVKQMAEYMKVCHQTIFRWIKLNSFIQKTDMLSDRKEFLFDKNAFLSYLSSKQETPR